MPVNYHTHTFRCGHAENVPDEAYLQRAIEQGFTVLGFSDHTPWQGLSPAVCRGVRMLPEELPGYFASIHALQEKYRGVIEIPLGLECEYFPGHMDYLREIRPQVDYLILGNHFQWADPEHPRAYTAAPMLLEEYLTTTLAGMRTGLYAYLAHPDLFMRDYGKPFDENGRAAAKELCQACKALDIPMEYNLHDRFLSPVTHRRSYPDAHFFEIVRQEGVRVLIGVDAHEPEEIRNPAQWALASRELEPFGALFEDHLCL